MLAARPAPPPPSASPASVTQKYFGDARERAREGRAGPGEDPGEAGLGEGPGYVEYVEYIERAINPQRTGERGKE